MTQLRFSWLIGGALGLVWGIAPAFGVFKLLIPPGNKTAILSTSNPVFRVNILGDQTKKMTISRDGDYKLAVGNYAWTKEDGLHELVLVRHSHAPSAGLKATDVEAYVATASKRLAQIGIVHDKSTVEAEGYLRTEVPLVYTALEKEKESLSSEVNGRRSLLASESKGRSRMGQKDFARKALLLTNLESLLVLLEETHPQVLVQVLPRLLALHYDLMAASLRSGWTR